MNKTVLVTGGAGFIGSNFVRHLYENQPEYRIINFDALTYAGNLENLADIAALEEDKQENKQRYIFVEGDICEEDDLRAVFEKYDIDIVVNFAAESHVDRSFVNADAFVRTNVHGAYIVSTLVHEYGIKRFVHISTDEVYGDVPEGESFEDSVQRPSNPYAASKSGADLLIQSLIKSRNLPAVMVRGSNNFGPYQYPEKLIPLTITNLLEGEVIPVHGSGEQIRTWLHVQDFVEAVQLIMEKAKDGAIYNISGVEHSNITIIRNVCKILGLDPDDSVKFVGDRPGADMRYAPNSDKLRDELGWSPKLPLSETLESIVEWYQDNAELWKKIKRRSEFTDHYEKQRKAKYY